MAHRAARVREQRVRQRCSEGTNAPVKASALLHAEPRIPATLNWNTCQRMCPSQTLAVSTACSGGLSAAAASWVRRLAPPGLDVNSVYHRKATFLGLPMPPFAPATLGRQLSPVRCVTPPPAVPSAPRSAAVVTEDSICLRGLSCKDLTGQDRNCEELDSGHRGRNAPSPRRHLPTEVMPNGSRRRIPPGPGLDQELAKGESALVALVPGPFTPCWLSRGRRERQDATVTQRALTGHRQVLERVKPPLPKVDYKRFRFRRHGSSPYRQRRPDSVGL